MIDTEYDVIVVGAGPAGAAASRASVERGLKTLIIEMKKIPRIKQCAGLLFPGASRFLSKHMGPIPDEVRAKPHELEGMRIHFDGRQFDIKIRMQSVWRDSFDQWLSGESGARVSDQTRLLDFSEWKDHVELICNRRGKSMVLHSKVMIAADGCSSGIVKKIDPAFNRGLPGFYTQQDYYRCDSKLERSLFHLFADTRLGLYSTAYSKDEFLVTDTSVRIGEKVNPARLGFRRFLQEQYGLQSTEPESTLGCMVFSPPAINRFCLGTRRVLIAGEAAGFIKFGYEGISPALATGRLAGLAAAEDRGSPGRVYEEITRQERADAVKDFLLTAIFTGRAFPEFRKSLSGLTFIERLRVLRGLMTWQLKGGALPGLDRNSLEVIFRRLIHGDYEFRG